MAGALLVGGLFSSMISLFMATGGSWGGSRGAIAGAVVLVLAWLGSSLNALVFSPKLVRQALTWASIKACKS